MKRFFLTMILLMGNFLSADESLLFQLSLQVKQAIEHSESIPGLQIAELSSLRKDMLVHWDALVEKGILEISGEDKEVRPSFVGLQAVVENVLSSALNKQVKKLSGYIHTPMPATPLCSKGEISKTLVDVSFENDQKRLFTVKARTTVVRDYLRKEGKLYIAYPKQGLFKRSEQEQAIYQQELQNYSKNLFDTPLQCDLIPEELIGATYFFYDEIGNLYVFGIKMTQAKSPAEKGNFALWFGSIENENIKNRAYSIMKFLKENSSFHFDL